MDATTYPGSDTDMNEEETYENRDLHSMASNQLDFVDNWVNLTVEKEVLRGSKLREEKPRSYSPQDEYEVVNINLVRSPCADMNKLSRYRKRSPGRTKVKNVSCSPRSNSPFIGPKLPKSRGYTQQTVYSRPNSASAKAKRVRRCPMRIAELAVPTKRQCIDTWRNKYDVLPSFMVERLRQQIMDEKPVVQIKEAISCFKRKPRSVKRSNKQIIRDSKLKNERMDEIRALCVFFANRIGQRLITPQNLQLTPELQKISKVVTGELTMIVKNRKKCDLDEVANRIIQADIADKIAIWIAMILEDTSYKILEEDLRVKKHSERDVKEESLLTLIEKILHHGKASELEEEEGPVLDFLDDLIDNVMTICEPQVNDIEEIDNVSEATSKGTQNSNITYNTGDDTIRIINDVVPEIEGIELNINDHIRGELQNIVDSAIPEADQGYENKDDLEKTEPNQTDFTSEHIDLLPEAPGNAELTSYKPVQNETDLALEDVIDSDKNSFEDGTDDPKPGIDNDSEDTSKPVQSDTDVPLEADKPDIENVKTSDVLSDEGSLDDKNKKVKFSEVQMDGDDTRTVESNSEGHQRERLSWHSSIDIHDIVFAPPNDHLLSDADELWPDDITTPVLKPSASVSRSITSLGKILERDEKLQPDEDAEDMQHTELEIATHDDRNNSQTAEQLEIVHNLLVNLQEDKIAAPIKDESKPDSTHESKPEDITEETTSSITTIKTTVEKTMADKTVEAVRCVCDVTPETKRLIIDSSTSPIKIAIDDDSIKQKQAIAIRTDKQLTEKDIKNLESDTNVIYEAVQQKMRSSYAIAQPKHDYKVHANTAPSWLRHDHGKGEPSEDSFLGSKSKDKLKDTEIRNWCKDLDRIYVNLEMWNDWIDSTCKNVLHLKQKREMCSCGPNASRKDARDWITLKKNIDKDAVLWTKLNQKAHERLKFYKRKSKFCRQPAKCTKQYRSTEVLNTYINEDKETVLKTVQEIDRLCLWMHRAIVSTEYCMLCDCKNNTKRKV